MRDAAGQHAERLELLRLRHAPLELLALRRRRHPLRDVHHDAERAHGTAIVTGLELGLHRHPAPIAVRFVPPHAHLALHLTHARGQPRTLAQELRAIVGVEATEDARAHGGTRRG